jgi:DNA-binding FadR family transcriptional regulator
VDADDFPLKQEFLAVMLGVRRPTVTDVLRALKEAGLISTRYGPHTRAQAQTARGCVV